MEVYEHRLENDLSWRESELASLKLLVAETTRGSVRERALLRALWAMLYAHYEGFCQFAWDTYLDHLQASAPIRANCVDSLARFSLADSLRSLRGNTSLENMWTYCTSEFQGLMSKPLAFGVRLETASNLWPDICRENSAKVGLRHDAVDHNRTKLTALVSRRNDIAHGQPMIVRTLQEYQQYETAAIEVMYELALDVAHCLSNRTYLR